ncbi:unnamed protein product (mitochondrion) [Plasmodiophora brassicae]|uniref:Uncharacterized protein n=1 Tax=Plasmodiophora brassicae TaxID=37360 RepID=A0A3P3YI46_PLABS|nr:unnamed protein product [Plasmodiophora brassicae]
MDVPHGTSPVSPRVAWIAPDDDDDTDDDDGAPDRWTHQAVDPEAESHTDACAPREAMPPAATETRLRRFELTPWPRDGDYHPAVDAADPFANGATFDEYMSRCQQQPTAPPQWDARAVLVGLLQRQSIAKRPRAPDW